MTSQTMSPITEALSRSAGAVFRCCALQVNTWAYAERRRQQHHGRIEAEFNADLAGTCARLGVQVVGRAGGQVLSCASRWARVEL